MSDLRELFRHAADQVAAETWPTGPEIRRNAARRRVRRLAAAGAASIAVVVAISLLSASLSDQDRPEPAQPDACLSAGAEGEASPPSIVARGRLAYADENGIWVFQPGRQPVRAASWAGGLPAVPDDTSIAWSPSLSTLLVATTCGTTLVAVDGSSARPLALQGGGMTRAVGATFSPDGSRIAYQVADLTGGTWALWMSDLSGNDEEIDPTGCYPVHTDGGDVSWSPDGRWLAVLCENGRTAVYSTISGQRTYTQNLAPGIQVVGLAWRRFDTLVAAMIQNDQHGTSTLWISESMLAGQGVWRDVARFTTDGAWCAPFPAGPFSEDGETLLARQTATRDAEYPCPSETYVTVDPDSGQVVPATAVNESAYAASYGWLAGTQSLLGTEIVSQGTDLVLTDPAGRNKRTVATIVGVVPDGRPPASPLGAFAYDD